MFWIWDAQGIQRPYAREASSPSRSVSPVERIGQIRPIRTFQETLVENETATFRRQSATKAYRAAVRALEDEHAHALPASELMTCPASLASPTDTLEQLWSQIRLTGHRRFPVVGANEKLVGFVSERNLFLSALQPKEPESWKSLSIAEVMTSPVLTAKPETAIRDIAKVLYEERINGVPIVSEEGDVIGMLTRSDILRTIIQMVPLELWL